MLAGILSSFFPPAQYSLENFGTKFLFFFLFLILSRFQLPDNIKTHWKSHNKKYKENTAFLENFPRLQTTAKPKNG